jgi:hypothetical protein
VAAIKSQDEMPLIRYYDKVVVVVALVILLVSLAWLITAGVTQKENVNSYMSSVESLKPAKSDLPAIDLSPYDKALTAVTLPARVVEGNETKPSFLLPERRVFCANAACMKPIFAEAEQCWSCGEKQPPTGPRDPDLKQTGGVPAKWLRDMDVPLETDVALDLDDDGFSTLEEFLSKTHPKDKSFHPPYAEKLVLKEMKSVRLPLLFSGVNSMPGNVKQLIFNWTGKLPRTYWVKENQAIGDTGYTAGAVTVKTEKRENPNTPGIPREVDISTVVIKRKLDGKEIVLHVKEPEQNTDVEATVEFSVDKLELKLVENQEFTLRDETYRVVELDMPGGVMKVENTANGKQQKVVRKLDS